MSECFRIGRHGPGKERSPWPRTEHVLVTELGMAGEPLRPHSKRRRSTTSAGT